MTIEPEETPLAPDETVGAPDPEHQHDDDPRFAPGGDDAPEVPKPGTAETTHD